MYRWHVITSLEYSHVPKFSWSNHVLSWGWQNDYKHVYTYTYIISFAWATANLRKLFCVALCLQHAAEVLTLEPFLHWSLRCSCQLSQRGLVWYGFVKRIWSRWQTNFPLNKKVRSFHRWLSSFWGESFSQLWTLKGTSWRWWMIVKDLANNQMVWWEYPWNIPTDDFRMFVMEAPNSLGRNEKSLALRSY